MEINRNMPGTDWHLFRDIFDFAGVGMNVIDLEGRFLTSNSTFQVMVGYTAEELQNKTLDSITYPGDIGSDINHLKETVIASKSGIYKTEKRYVHKDGHFIWANLTATFIRDDRGALRYGLAVVEDIADRKRMEEALHYRLVLEELVTTISTSFINITLAEIDGEINHALQTIGEAMGDDRVFISIFSDDLTRFDQVYEWCDEGIEPGFKRFKAIPTEIYRWTMEQVKHFETLHIPDISILPVEAAGEREISELLGFQSTLCIPLVSGKTLMGILIFLTIRRKKTWTNEDIRLIKLIGEIFVNVLERKRSEEALLESEERYRKLVEFSPDAIILHSEGKIIFINNVGARLLGAQTPQEVIGRDGVDFIHPDYKSIVLERIKRLMGENTEPPLLEGKIIRLDGKIIDAEVASTGFYYRKKPLVLSIVRDITERKRSEEERRKFETQLLQTQKLESLGVLAGGIAHDFNNILTGILGYADLAFMELSAQTQAKEFVRNIVISARRASDLTKQMLAYSGMGRFVVHSIHLSALVKEMAQLLEISISKKCALKYDFSADLPLIEGDTSQIRQVVMNLIINASEAIGDRGGMIILRTGTTECDSAYLSEGYINENLPGLYVYLEVTDTGCGMEKEIISKIFDPFFTTKFTGRGLGLAAVLGIIRGHHGAIKVHSEPEHGTTFRILFPAVYQSADEPVPKKTGEKVWQGRGTVLVIDDEKIVCNTAGAMLERLGFSVLIASDGREGIEVFRTHLREISLVILDMTMPHMDGEETFRELCLIRNDVPVILSSGYNEQEAVKDFSGKKPAGFIQKPYLMEELRETLQKAIER